MGGNYRPDFVVGCSATGSVLFVELEDGGSKSFFTRRAAASNPKLAARLLGAISQVVDWSFQLTLLSDDGLEDLIGFVPTQMKFLVICGRDAAFTSKADKRRYRWVTTVATIDKRQVTIQTYEAIRAVTKIYQASLGLVGATPPAPVLAVTPVVSAKAASSTKTSP